MKYKTLITLLLGSLTLFSQSRNSGDTYAVIIGISDYQNQDIPDLRFAHKDAAAFAAYLKSPAGGSLTDEQLKILLNENATTAQIAAALEWLVEVSQEGDQAVIYFSGHGDVETKTMFQLGYLLTWDSPARTYVAGAFPLSYLQAVVSTLSLQNKAEVALITDACRAGKLAGTNVGGAQITNANLSKQFGNEIKILSCQPNEFSLEGEQWGNGRGVFSYHLLDGLYGLADSNEDFTVNLFEIGRYLEDKVSSETDPHSQFPMIVGSKNKTVAVVNESSLALLKEKRSRETPTLEVVESKGIEDMILADADSVWQKKYREFTAAIDEGRLLDSPTDEAAAYDLYVELSQAIELQKLHGTMQRNLAAALQDDAQQVINAYLETNPTELAKRYEAESNYEQHPRYLRKAAEILGAQNFYYPYIMAKLYYFEGLQIRLDADKKIEKASYEKAIELQTKALEFQEYAPFVLNELGVLHTRLRLTDKAVEYYDKAIELAPEWGLPYMNYCIEAYYSGDKEKAIEYGEKAINHNADFPQLFNLLAWVYADRNEFGSKGDWVREGVELSDDFIFYIHNLLNPEEKKQHYKRPIELLEKAVKIDSNYAAGHLNLGFCYMEVGRLEKAIFQLEKSIELDSTNHLAYSRLGSANRHLENYEAGVKAFQKAIELTLDDPITVSDWYSNFGILYHSWEKYDKALEQYQNSIKASPYSFAHIGAAEVYSVIGDYEKAEFFNFNQLLYMPQHSGNYELVGDHYFIVNRFEDAEIFYLKSLEMQPDFRNAALSLIHLYQKTGNLTKAQELKQKFTVTDQEINKIESGFQKFFKTLKNKPEKPLYFPTGCVRLGEFYERENMPDRAVALYKKAIEIKSEKPTKEEAIFMALAYLKLNDWEKAQAVCPEKIESGDAIENLLYGQIYYKLNRFEKAEAHFQKYLHLSQDHYGLHRIGIEYYTNGDLTQTEKYLKKVIEINHDDPQFYYYATSHLHFSYGNHLEAINIIEEGIQKHPEEFVFKILRAFIISDSSPNGMEAFEALEPLQPGASKIGVFLNLMAEENYEAAAKSWEEITETLPPQIFLLNIPYVRLLTAQKDFSGAMDIIAEDIFHSYVLIFNYQLLMSDPALAPLRETNEFKDYMQRNFPGKINQ